MNIENWEIETISDESILGSANETTSENFQSTSNEIPRDKAYGNYSTAGDAINDSPNVNGNTRMNMGTIPAEAVIEAGDKVLSSLTVLIAGFFDVKIDKKEVALTAGEKTSLKEPMQNWLNTQNITLSPGQALLLQIGGIYAAKGIAIYSNYEPASRSANDDGIPDLNNIGKATGKKRGPYKPRAKK